jgi:hypothetical protein
MHPLGRKMPAMIRPVQRAQSQTELSSLTKEPISVTRAVVFHERYGCTATARLFGLGITVSKANPRQATCLPCANLNSVGGYSTPTSFVLLLNFAPTPRLVCFFVSIPSHHPETAHPAGYMPATTTAIPFSYQIQQVSTSATPWPPEEGGWLNKDLRARFRTRETRARS